MKMKNKCVKFFNRLRIEFDDPFGIKRDSNERIRQSLQLVRERRAELKQWYEETQTYEYKVQQIREWILPEF